MSTAHKKTAPGRTSGGGVADPKISGSAQRKDYSNSESDASIYLGRRLIGFVIHEPRQVAALRPDRRLIGLFPDLKAATHAIFVNDRPVSAA